MRPAQTALPTASRLQSPASLTALEMRTPDRFVSQMNEMSFASALGGMTNLRRLACPATAETLSFLGPQHSRLGELTLDFSSQNIQDWQVSIVVCS